MTHFPKGVKMLHSMTGFTRVRSRQRGGWSVEIRSLNHRYFEFSLKAPPSLYALEDRVRELCQTRIRRGKVNVNITEAEEAGLDRVTLDHDVLRFYLSAIRKLERRFGLKGPRSVSDLLLLPRIFSVEKKGESPDKIWRVLEPLVEKALEHLLESRFREGKELQRDLLARIRKIGEGLSRIEKRAKKLPNESYERLKARIEELIGGASVQPERLEQEVAFLAEKADATEEIVRLRSHLGLFRDKVTRGAEVGRELDFVLQEMNREVNTLGAKGQDFGISKEVVGIKAELEKIREQVQNIE